MLLPSDRVRAGTILGRTLAAPKVVAGHGAPKSRGDTPDRSAGEPDRPAGREIQEVGQQHPTADAVRDDRELARPQRVDLCANGAMRSATSGRFSPAGRTMVKRIEYACRPFIRIRAAISSIVRPSQSPQCRSTRRSSTVTPAPTTGAHQSAVSRVRPSGETNMCSTASRASSSPCAVHDHGLRPSAANRVGPACAAADSTRFRRDGPDTDSSIRSPKRRQRSDDINCRLNLWRRHPIQCRIASAALQRAVRGSNWSANE